MGTDLRRLCTALVLSASVLCVAACSSAIPAFDRVQVDGDLLPADVSQGLNRIGGLPETSRMVGTSADGSRYFVTAREVEGQCLVVVDGRSAGVWVGGCERNFPVVVGIGDFSATLHPYGSPLLDGGVEVIADQIVIQRQAP